MIDAPVSVRIRPAEERDLPAISALLDQMGYPIPTDVLREQFRSIRSMAPLAIAAVALRQDRVMGVVHAFVSPVLHRTRPMGRVSLIAVDQLELGQGIGSELLQHAERFLGGHGCHVIEAVSGVQRHRAHGFYARRGYAEQGLRFTKRLDASSAEVRAFSAGDSG